MGFESIYRILQELFPQVDARLLKAAAIEHSKDPYGAIDFILTDVIPHTMEKSDASIAVNGSLGSSVKCVRKCSLDCASSSEHESTAASKAAVGSEIVKSPHHVYPPCLNEKVQDLLGSTLYEAEDFNDHLSGYAGSNVLSLLTTSKTWEGTHQHVPALDISAFPINAETDNGDCNQEPEIFFGETSKMQEYQDSGLPTGPLSASSTSALLKDGVSDVSLINKSNDNSDSDCDRLSGNSNVAVHTLSPNKQPNFESDSLYGSLYVELASLSVKDHTLESLNCSIESDVESFMSDSRLENSEHKSVADAAVREDIQDLHNANTEESSSSHNLLTQSVQVCNTDFLENVIEDSTSHKKKLLSDLESVLKLMKEVELHENAAEQAKKDAGEGALEIWARVDELKSMLDRAREANDMHAGEVYGERAILATEMKELQSRLLALSDLNDQSLSILDVMRQTLEARLTAAEMERAAAEQEKYEREESARKVLAEQELIMEKVVQESKLLQEEAEENARLRDFLMDRGRVVDMLQGEISVVCQDVKLLKEKFDNRVPLSQSLSAEQTSCILASSGSSRKSTGSEQSLKHDTPFIESVEPIMLPSVEQVTADTQNKLLEDGWELYEDVVKD